MRTTESIALAPGAGDGLGQLIAAALLADPGLADEMAATLRRGMRATVRRWDPGAKDWLVDPDTRSQLQAVALVMSHMVGEPTKRVVHQYLGAGADVDPLAALRESPVLQGALERTLEKARWQHSGHQASKRPRPKAPAEVMVVE